MPATNALACLSDTAPAEDVTGKHSIQVVSSQCPECVQALTVEEAKERRERMAKMRSLLFAHEQKAKRLKAIKSKGFHRHAKKAAKMKVRGSFMHLHVSEVWPVATVRRASSLLLSTNHQCAGRQANR